MWHNKIIVASFSGPTKLSVPARYDFRPITNIASICLCTVYNIAEHALNIQGSMQVYTCIHRYVYTSIHRYTWVYMSTHRYNVSVYIGIAYTGSCTEDTQVHIYRELHVIEPLKMALTMALNLTLHDRSCNRLCKIIAWKEHGNEATIARCAWENGFVRMRSF